LDELKVLALESIYPPGEGEVALNVLSRPEVDLNSEPTDGLFCIQVSYSKKMESFFPLISVVQM
jgi:hypothetical protein